ncbi:3-octaprenyl-4-hydroxybenzoate carboxy-lyase [Striga asiatica]|uniref:3-octaprenyl-4-hydroxybenzoate carboxy-lyase n=1 Tax=Striga asiatica TaxID=4170 RepID=A0A5A7RI37_STRAF|nr:3-octaprenyl-4-hydroxybenzoate carboxy-lyase [Striga asiatica]
MIHKKLKLFPLRMNPQLNPIPRLQNPHAITPYHYPSKQNQPIAIPNPVPRLHRSENNIVERIDRASFLASGSSNWTRPWPLDFQFLRSVKISRAKIVPLPNLDSRKVRRSWAVADGGTLATFTDPKIASPRHSYRTSAALSLEPPMFAGGVQVKESLTLLEISLPESTFWGIIFAARSRSSLAPPLSARRRLPAFEQGLREHHLRCPESLEPHPACDPHSPPAHQAPPMLPKHSGQPHTDLKASCNLLDSCRDRRYVTLHVALCLLLERFVIISRPKAKGDSGRRRKNNG